MKNKKTLIVALFLILLPYSSLAQEVGGDLSMEAGAIKTKEAVIAGKEVRLYATVKNNSGKDLLGTVKFYDETKGAFIGEDQPVSIVANGTDEVFVDWKAESVGDKSIAARVIPWESKGDNANNNKTSAKIYVDVDSDNDGIANRQDPDDDNDGTKDEEDAFPEDAKETEDTDKDGIGNNADDDDDNDNTGDVEDAFPKDPKEIVDTDGDGVGDKADAFPKNSKEAVDEDGDGWGKNADPDDHNLGPLPKIKIKDSVVMIGASVLFDGSESKDPDGKVASYEWNFGKGFEAKGQKVKKEFEKAGNYDVILKATDDKGEPRTKKITMTVIHRWQSIPFLVSFIVIILLLTGGLTYKIKKNRSRKKNTLPTKRK